MLTSEVVDPQGPVLRWEVPCTLPAGLALLEPLLVQESATYKEKFDLTQAYFYVLPIGIISL